jgi:hypothetical protein
MVIAVWLTLNVSADATGLLERLDPARSTPEPATGRLLQHADEHRPQCPMLLASMSSFGSAWRGVSVSPMARSDSSARSRSTKAPS